MVGGTGSMISSFGTVGMWMLLPLGTTGTTLLAFLVWSMIEVLRREERPVVVTSATFEDGLRERLERGEISAREFEDALCVLRDS